MSSAGRTEMVKNLNKIVVPVLRNLNFKGSFPHFRRETKERINTLTFQFDRSGGGFIIEIANCGPGIFTMRWGLQVKPSQITAHHMDKRKRIQSNMDTESSLNKDWFRYDKKYLFGFGNIYKKVCSDVLSKLDIAEEYWKNGEVNKP